MSVFLSISGFSFIVLGGDINKTFSFSEAKTKLIGYSMFDVILLWYWNCII